MPCPSCGSTDGNARWGHEVRGVYDGVLVWFCAACGHYWPREFTGSPGLQRKAEEHAALLRAGNG